MARWALISDTHFTHRSANDHFWNLFPQVETFLDANEIDYLGLLGDLTNEKDCHPGKVVNRIANGLVRWSKLIKRNMFILRGNHDDIGEEGYFSFLSHIPGIIYINKPAQLDENEDGSVPLTFLPHSRDPKTDWKDINIDGQLVFTHITVDKCFAESGQRMDSDIEAGFFNDSLITFSGDIHMPQQMGPTFVYVGSPYNTRFGDRFDGGLVVLDTEKLKKGDSDAWHRAPLQFPRKLTMEATNAYQVHAFLEDFEKDHSIPAQVKIKLKVDQSNMESWNEIKKEIEKVIKDHGHSYFDTDVKQEWKVPLPSENRVQSTEASELPVNDFEDFCAAQGLTDEVKKTGEQIMAEYTVCLGP